MVLWLLSPPGGNRLSLAHSQSNPNPGPSAHYCWYPSLLGSSSWSSHRRSLCLEHLPRQLSWPTALLHGSPVAATTNDHRPSGSKQHKVILNGSGVQTSEGSLLGLKSRHQQGRFLLEAPGESPFAAFPTSKGAASLALGPSSIVTASRAASSIS